MRVIARSTLPSRRLVNDRFLQGLSPVKFEGPTSANPLPTIITTRTRSSWASAWKTISARPWPIGTPSPGGGDPFGGRSLTVPWYDKGMDGAKIKADIAFEFFDLLDMPFFCFHDADVAPGGDSFAEHQEPAHHHRHLRPEDGKSRTKLLWGTANLFSNRRYMAGAATNPTRTSSPIRPRR